MLMTILIVLLIVSLVGGGLGHSRVGVAGWSPAGVLIVVVMALWLTGGLS